MNIQIELHAHTSEVSNCGQLTAKELVSLHAEAGYRMIVTTDHCCHDQWQYESSLKERSEAFLQGFRAAKEAGAALNVDVLLGMEARLADGPEDYLVFGLSEDHVPLLIEKIAGKRGLPEFYAFVKASGLLLIQAHPNRQGLRPSDPAYVDGYEIVNGNPRHLSGNEKTKAYVEGIVGKTMICTAGSDVHRPEDVGRVAILSPEVIREEAALVAFLRNNPRSTYRDVDGVIR